MIINLKSETDLSGFYIVYEGAANLETNGVYGCSHLLEHLSCKFFFHLIEDFDRDGISWNASTSENEILFFFVGLESKLAKYRLKIIESLSKFTTTKEQFENEKKIVLQEYSRTFNDQESCHDLNLYRKLFNVYQPIGLRQDLENLKFLDYIKFYEKFYTKPSKIINISKTYTFKDPTIEFSNKKIDFKIKYGDHDVPFELGNKFKEKTSVIFLSPIIEKDNAYVNFLNTMISLGLKSPLINEIREKRALVYTIHCYQNRFNNQGITSIDAQIENDKFDDLVDGVKHVFEKPSLFLNKERFNLVRDFYLIKKQKEEILRYENIGKYLLPKDWQVEGILKDITLSKIRDVYEKYYSDFDKFYISSDKTEFKK